MAAQWHCQVAAGVELLMVANFKIKSSWDCDYKRAGNCTEWFGILGALSFVLQALEYEVLRGLLAI